MIQVARMIVGRVPRAYAECERFDRSVPIDVARARAQHEAYVQALPDVAIEEVDVDEEHPDAVFVEDAVVVLDAGRVVLTRPGAPSRQPEVEAVAETLARFVAFERMPAPATLDGGDVLRASATQLVVGLTGRTSRRGADWLAAIAREHGIDTIVADVPSGLHLKSACALADAHTLLYDPRVLDESAFTDLNLDVIAVNEPRGANVLALGAGRVLMSRAAPRTADLLVARGLSVTLLDISELEKADAAVTCCSVRIPPPSGWCT